MRAQLRGRSDRKIEPPSLGNLGLLSHQRNEHDEARGGLSHRVLQPSTLQKEKHDIRPIEREPFMRPGLKPTLAFEASTAGEASQLRKEKWLHGDLIGLTSNGSPVWDGKARLSVRNALENEIEQYVEAAAAAKTGEGELFLAYLVELDS